MVGKTPVACGYAGSDSHVLYVSESGLGWRPAPGDCPAITGSAKRLLGLFFPQAESSYLPGLQPGFLVT